MATKQERIQTLVVPVVEALGCEFWGIEYMSQGRHTTLRVYIDREEIGVALEDCENISRQLSAVLDVEDPIAGEYTLEVSSPGMDRPLYTLAHYLRYVGEKLELRLRVPYEGRRRFSGLLQSVEGEEIVILVDDHEYIFPVDSIEKANIIPRL